VRGQAEQEGAAVHRGGQGALSGRYIEPCLADSRWDRSGRARGNDVRRGWSSDGLGMALPNRDPLSAVKNLQRDGRHVRVRPTRYTTCATYPHPLLPQFLHGEDDKEDEATHGFTNAILADDLISGLYTSRRSSRPRTGSLMVFW